MDGLAKLAARFQGREPGLLGARRSYAVLCPLVERDGALHVLYEVRAKGLRQGGEVCFPGGLREPGETAEDCALRETEEELAIPRNEVDILGPMDFICNQRGFLLHPFLGVVSPAGFAAMRPSPAEVAEAFTVPLAYLRETPPQVWTYALVPQVPENFPYETIGIGRDYPWADGKVEIPVWHWQGRAIWGMTGRITKDLAEW